jgi:hypothetical protein
MTEPYRFAEARASSLTKLDHFQQRSIQFIKSVRETYGADKASAVVSSLSESLGKEWSNKLIYDIVVGPEMLINDSDIVISALTFPHLIQMIKAIRGASSMGLKDAKDAVDGLHNRTHAWIKSTNFASLLDAPTLIIQFRPTSGITSRAEAIKELQDVGFHVHE